MKKIFLALVLNIFLIDNAFSINQKPGIEDLEDKILDLEKRVSALEKTIQNSPSQNKKSDDYSETTGIQFSDNTSEKIVDSDEESRQNQITNLDSQLTIDQSPMQNLEPTLDIRNLYNKSIEEIRMQNYDKSSNFLNTILTSKNAKSNDRETQEIIANSNYLIGEIYFKKGDYQNASRHLLESYNIFHSIDKNNTQGANSLFQLAKSLKAMNKIESSCNTLKKIKHEFVKISENLQNKIDIESSQIKCNLE